MYNFSQDWCDLCYLPSLFRTTILLPVAFAISISSSLELVLELSLQEDDMLTLQSCSRLARQQQTNLAIESVAF